MTSPNENSLSLWAAVLLLTSGLLLFPELYMRITDITGGFPWVQVGVGVLCILVSLMLFAGPRKPLENKEVAPYTGTGENNNP